jgi:hypothetical protein
MNIRGKFKNTLSFGLRKRGKSAQKYKISFLGRVSLTLSQMQIKCSKNLLNFMQIIHFVYIPKIKKCPALLLVDISAWYRFSDEAPKEK